ncbi:MAG: hypothetical protein AB7T63_12545 [Planctomycetota bacterium]
MSAPHPHPGSGSPEAGPRGELSRVLAELAVELESALDLDTVSAADPRGLRASAWQRRLDAALEGAAPLSAADARRVGALRHRLALAARRDRAADVVAEVTARLPEPGSQAWRRAVLGDAFLQAPASLARWRRAAMAAALMAGVGLAWTRVPEGGAPARLAAGPDPRAELLEPLGPEPGGLRWGWSEAGGAGGAARTVGWPQVPRPEVDPWAGRALRILPLRIHAPRAFERAVDPFFGVPRASDDAQAPVERN